MRGFYCKSFSELRTSIALSRFFWHGASVETLCELRSVAVDGSDGADLLASWSEVWEKVEAAHGLRDRVLAGLRDSALPDHVVVPRRYASFDEACPPILLFERGPWNWLSTRLAKHTSRNTDARSILRYWIKLLDALIWVALRTVNTPEFIVRVLLTEKSFFDFHGLGRPPSLLSAAARMGLAEDNAGRMHSTGLVPA